MEYPLDAARTVNHEHQIYAAFGCKKKDSSTTTAWPLLLQKGFQGRMIRKCNMKIGISLLYCWRNITIGKDINYQAKSTAYAGRVRDASRTRPRRDQHTLPTTKLTGDSFFEHSVYTPHLLSDIYNQFFLKNF
uniref:Uncharacterized protein n=1 Tax=Romanomermis culicivorax TaxID=13658 RepID=A0A915KCZ7_ROMCU